MFDRLENLDQQLLIAINGAHNPFFDSFMWFISTKAIMFGMLIFSIFLAYRLMSKKGTIIFAVAMFLAFGCADLISVHGLKNRVQRYRPSHHLEIGQKLHLHQEKNGEFYKGGEFGFVSSHATNYFCVAFFILITFWKKSKGIGYLCLFLAALVSYSRIYLGVHYPSDVIVGGLLGITIAFIAYKITCRFMQFKKNE